MLFLANLSSFHPRNWVTLGPTVAILLAAGLALYLALRHRPRPGHASVKSYILIAVILTVITIVEIAILPLSESGALGLPQHVWLIFLYVLATVKFVMVLMFFMHLYFDRWLYTMFFGIGMLGILGTLWALLSIFPGEPVRTPEPWEPKKASGHEQGQAAPQADLAALSPAQRGERVFVAMQCGHCHAVEAVPQARGTFGPALDGLALRAGSRVQGMGAEAYIRQSIEEPGAYVPRGFFDGMPALREKMTQRDYEDLVRYLLTLGSADAAGRPPAA